MTVTRGIPRVAAGVMRAADEHNQTFIDERVMDETLAMLTGPK